MRNITEERVKALKERYEDIDSKLGIGKKDVYGEYFTKGADVTKEFLEKNIFPNAKEFDFKDPATSEFPALTDEQKLALGHDAVIIYNTVRDYKMGDDEIDWIKVAKDAKLLTNRQVEELDLENPDIPLEEKLGAVNNIKDLIVGSGEQIFFGLQIESSREFNGMMPFELARNYFLQNDKMFKFDPEKEEFDGDVTAYNKSYSESLYLKSIKEILEKPEFYDRIEKELSDRLYKRTIKRTTETIKQISDKKRYNNTKKTATRDTSRLDEMIRLLFPDLTKLQSRVFVYAMSKCFTKKNTLQAALTCYLTNSNIISLIPIMAYKKDDSELAGSARILFNNLTKVFNTIKEKINK